MTGALASGVSPTGELGRLLRLLRTDVGSRMVDHSAWRLELARACIESYAERAPIAVLGGSVAQGVADRWSDIDTLVYWDTIDRDWLETPPAARNGERFA
jgi:hypothetical protein